MVCVPPPPPLPPTYRLLQFLVPLLDQMPLPHVLFQIMCACIILCVHTFVCHVCMYVCSTCSSGGPAWSTHKHTRPSFLHALEAEVGFTVAPRFKGHVGEVQLVVALKVHRTRPQGPVLNTPQTDVVPSTRDHPAGTER